MLMLSSLTEWTRNLINNRNADQCCEKWRASLDPGISSAAFSAQEDKLLNHLLSVIDAGEWSRIADFYPNRTQEQLRKRWLQLASAKDQSAALVKRKIVPPAFGR